MTSSSQKSPGKVILSGEHAVVHGAPAIGCPIDLFTTCLIETPLTSDYFIYLKDLEERIKLPLNGLTELKQEIDNRYEQFLQGKSVIGSVLRKTDLAPYTVALFFEETKIKPYPLSIMIESDIPIGSGLGSSAALICSLIKSLNTLFNTDLSDDQLFQMAKIAESRQHGRSSGLDIAICQRGYPLYFEGLAISECKTIYPPFKLIFTGKPVATTGASVSHTAAIFKKNPQLLEEFTYTTRALAKPQTHEDFLALIKRNHALLIKIGVVPKEVQQLIKAVEESGGAGKITGAGSIDEGGAGAVILFD